MYKVLKIDDLPELKKVFNLELINIGSFKDGNNLDSSEDYGDFVTISSRLIVLGRCIHELKVYGDTNYTSKILEP